MNGASVQRVVMEPDASRWQAMAEERFALLDERGRCFREQLGLPTDRPLVMTGHQATFWPCGVLAKYLAAQAVCDATGFDATWLVADQDIHEHGPLLAPVRDRAGRLQAVGTILMGCAGTHVATGSCAAFDPAEPALGELRYAEGSVEAGMRSIIDSLHAHRQEPCAARQIANAAADLISPILPTRQMVYASELLDTELGASLLDALTNDHGKAIEMYNDAARQWPDAGITPMGDGELPLWHLQAGLARERVFAADARAPAHQLAPRAILMSGMIRMAACDLFIVGTGGQSYDRVTERWFESWMGCKLAPRVMVTADVLLPLHESVATEQELARARWLAHSSRHNPSLLGLGSESDKKLRLVGAIKNAKETGSDASALFGELHTMLSEMRRSHADALHALADRALELEQMLGERAIAHDRTWAFPLHDESSLAMLKDQIQRRFTAAQSPCQCSG